MVGDVAFDFLQFLKSYIFLCAPWPVYSALLQRCSSPPSACDRRLSGRRTGGWTQDPRPAGQTLRGGRKQVKSVCAALQIAVPEPRGCTVSTRNTCHFGKNTLFDNGRQHLPVCVLELLVAVAVTESLRRREPRQGFQVGGRVLENNIHSYLETRQEVTWSTRIPAYREGAPRQQLMSDDGVQQLGQAEGDVGVVVGVRVESSPLFETWQNLLDVAELVLDVGKQLLRPQQDFICGGLGSEKRNKKVEGKIIFILYSARV